MIIINKTLNKFYKTLESKRRIAEMRGLERFSYDNSVVNHFLLEIAELECEHDEDFSEAREEIQETNSYAY
jgi:hypothetical protein